MCDKIVYECGIIRLSFLPLYDTQRFSGFLHRTRATYVVQVKKQDQVRKTKITVAEPGGGVGGGGKWLPPPEHRKTLIMGQILAGLRGRNSLP